MEFTFVILAIILKMTWGQIGRGRSQEGEELLLTCSKETLASWLPNDQFNELFRLTLSRRTLQGDTFTNLIEINVKEGLVNYTNAIIATRGWSLSYRQNQGILLTMKPVGRGDAGVYLCQGLIELNNKTKTVNVTQELTIIPAPSSPTDTQSDLPTPAIIAIAVTIVIMAMLAVVLWILVKDQCKHGKKLRHRTESLLEDCWLSGCCERTCQKRERRERVEAIKKKYRNKNDDNNDKPSDNIKDQHT